MSVLGLLIVLIPVVLAAASAAFTVTVGVIWLFFAAGLCILAAALAIGF